MSFLNTTHSTLTTTSLPASITKSQVLALLHNHDRMITLNPLVTNYQLLPPSASVEFFKHESSSTTKTQSNGEPILVYEVTDDMSVAATGNEGEGAGGSGGCWRGGWAKRFVPDSITYNSSMQDTEDGLVSITHAPMGVHSVTTWVVREIGEGGEGLVLEERGNISSNRLLMGFIKTTLQDSHEKLVKDFVAELERELGDEEKAEEEDAVES